MKQKAFFIVFEGLSFDEKNKNLMKIVDTSFKLLLLPGESLRWSVVFVTRLFTASGPSGFCTPLQVFSSLASSVIFWAAVFESIFGRLHLEQRCSFRDLVIRP